ncbi:MAG: hypothetical protein PHX08_11695 [Lachnospiraceae bacterium]|nr:hypothetical protein [Lachnospiraceae bacterium]
MSTMAYWHNKKWEVIPSKVENIEEIQGAYELESAKVMTKTTTALVTTLDKKGRTKTTKKKVKSQYIKAILSNQSISFNTTYQVATGTKNIMGELMEWKGLLGYSAPLILGSEVWGVSEMQLTKFSYNLENDELGRIIKAVVNFTLAETTDKTILGYSKKNLSNSAIIVGATLADKASKKSYSI